MPREKNTYKQIYKAECWNCGQRYSLQLKRCPRCEIENEDYRSFNNPNNLTYSQEDYWLKDY